MSSRIMLYYCNCCGVQMAHYVDDDEPWEENTNITISMARCMLCDDINAMWLNLEENKNG